MYSQVATIVNATGLHARPASLFSKTAAGFESSVTVKKTTDDGGGANAKSMLSLMAQGLSCGTEIRITAEGTDEQRAVETLVELLRSGCGE